MPERVDLSVTPSSRRPTAPVPSRARWVAVVLLTVYGFAKLNGAQFTVLDSELTKPMGRVSGFWLTWYYFGYSPIYGTLIALAQIGGAVLLAFRRTALLASLLLVPVMVNIVLIDVLFRIDVGATIVALLILLCLVTVIAPHLRRLREAAMIETAPHGVVPRMLFVAAVLALACGFTYWVANDNNREPTPIDGVWSVGPAADGMASIPRWNRVFFERNRAQLVVFRGLDGQDEEHGFDVTSSGDVRVWQRWLSKTDLILQGHVERDGSLLLEVLAGPDKGQRLVLTRDATRLR